MSEGEEYKGTKNKLGVSQCPGKRLAMGRDGKSHNRNIKQDVEQFRSLSGITLVVCLLNDSELRSLGVVVKDYRAACEAQGVHFFQHPILEMAPPEDLASFKAEVVDMVCRHLVEGDGNVLVHCRGGVGRAGLLTCCVLATLFEFSSHKKIIELVRKRRDKRCVESRKQEDFV